LTKTKAYFKRFQVKYRRRREGKTDYYARKRLVVQDKNKYNSPKYRFVVRLTNKQVLCQVIYSKIEGDVVMASASSKDLPEYGIKFGLTNWSAAYAVGLLCARRVLTKVGLADKYQGVTEPNGEFYEVEALDGDSRPFKAFLDVGLRRTTTGARVFAAMKGASDGGMYIPHSEKRFPGYDASKKTLDAETLRGYIYGEHVSSYMSMLQEDDEEAFKRQFSNFLKNDVGADDLEDLYRDCH
jgi:large subunit ribosomal protein L5e